MMPQIPVTYRNIPPFWVDFSMAEQQSKRHALGPGRSDADQFFGRDEFVAARQNPDATL